MGYYRHLAQGQYDLWKKQQPVSQLLQSEQISDELKHKLILTQEALTFAEKELSLSPGESYQGYVDTGRPSVVWNLMAAPALSLEATQWCYPIVGCQSYRGYFELPRAQAAENELKQEGMDTYIGGVAAYSTLGWLNDPLLNTFIYRKDDDLVALLFHELAHKVIYLKGDTAFNESFATAVEQLGLSQWQQANGITRKPPEGSLSPDELQQQFVALVEESLHKLQKIYASNAPTDEKLQQKAAEIAHLKARHDAWAHQLNIQSPYSHWFNSPINNAKLLTVANYHQYVPAFRQLWKESHGQWPVFYQQVKTFAAHPEAERKAQLSALALRFSHPEMAMPSK
ncbi:MAG: aminopeptidase [Hahellaceae bacterium]|nr:aminopeptidase [Hahellaceae bacterium]MCP5170467.1 aminopeptidase [Hahellaceae bacterium]